jgi:spore coat assembly protein SafA
MNKLLKSMLIFIVVVLMVTAGQASAAVYTVQSGDSLWKISVAQGVSVKQLIDMNRLSSTSLMPGQILQVPDPKHVYMVQPGDTMWMIAARFGISLTKLISANPQLIQPNQIWPGLQLNIPQKPKAYTDGVFPLSKGTYQHFVNDYSDGRGWTPDGQAVRKHEGVDIYAAQGTPVYSVLDGTIIRYGWNEYGGWRLTIQVDSATAFYYAHLSGYAAGLKNGSSVKKGQLIGYVGHTGYGPVGTEGPFLPHLHFGIYSTSTWTTMDPYPYLAWWSI